MRPRLVAKPTHWFRVEFEFSYLLSDEYVGPDFHTHRAYVCSSLLGIRLAYLVAVYPTRNKSEPNFRKKRVALSLLRCFYMVKCPFNRLHLVLFLGIVNLIIS